MSRSPIDEDAVNYWQKRVLPPDVITEGSDLSPKQKALAQLERDDGLYYDGRYRHLNFKMLAEFIQRYGEAYFTKLEQLTSISNERTNDVVVIRERQSQRLDITISWNQTAQGFLQELKDNTAYRSINPADLLGSLVTRCNNLGKENFNGAEIRTGGRTAAVTSPTSGRA